MDLLITNTRLGVVEGPELIRKTRERRPEMPILHVIHGNDPADGTPPDVVTLQEPFTPEHLLAAVRNLLA